MEPQEKISSVANKYNADYLNKYVGNYFVTLYALHHAKCKCRSQKSEWRNHWAIDKKGIYRFSNADFIMKNSNCQKCIFPCSSVVEYMNRLVNAENINDFSVCGYAFITIILDSDVLKYTSDELNDSNMLINCLRLYGGFVNGKYLAFPWLNNEKTLWDAMLKILPSIAKGSCVQKAIEILDNPRHKEWDKFKFLYEQILSCIVKKYYLLDDDQKECFNIALDKWKDLTGKNEPDPTII